MTFFFRKQSGATVTELLVVMGLILALIGYGTINLLGSREKASIHGTVQVLIADLKQQQIKSMVRDTEGRNFNSEYGVYLESTRYTIFHDTYTPSNSENFVVNLDDTIQITNTTFPASQILFTSGSGEIMNYVPGSSTITIRSSGNNEQKTIELNRYGVVTNIQ